MALAQVKLELMSLSPDKQYLPDYQQLDPKVVEQAKLMYLNCPNNPTGAVATPEFYEDTVKFTKNITLVSFKTLRNVQLALMVNAQSAFCRRRAPKKSAFSKPIRYLSHITWRVGALVLRWGTQT